jgi:hypothetical protein
MRRWTLRLLCLAGLLTAPAVFAAGGDPQPFLGSTGIAPVYTDLGGGFSSFSIPLTPELSERLLGSADSDDAAADKAQALTFSILAAGISQGLPFDPRSLPHAALADATFAYNYWVIVVNPGTQSLTRRTVLKLTGPGLHFTWATQSLYRPTSLTVVAYNPSAALGQEGLYTLQATVAGGGSFTIRSIGDLP